MMPKSRYAIMKGAHAAGLGRRSLEMMFGTATIQTNLDYVDEADMAKKFRWRRVGPRLSPPCSPIRPTKMERQAAAC